MSRTLDNLKLLDIWGVERRHGCEESGGVKG